MPTTVATPTDVNKVLNMVNAANEKIAVIEAHMVAQKEKDVAHDERLQSAEELVDQLSEQLHLLEETITNVKGDLVAAGNLLSARTYEIANLVQSLDHRLSNINERVMHLEMPTPPAIFPPNALYVPLFIYPGTVGRIQWQRVADIKAANPEGEIIAAINPNSGIFTAANADFLAGIDILDNAGVLCIGYVYTKYGNQNERTLDSIKQNILAYNQFYPKVKGIFLDEMASNDPAYYKQITDFAKANGLIFVMGNPGTAISPASIGCVDTSIVYENRGLPTMSLVEERTFNGAHPASNFGMIPYEVAGMPGDVFMNELKKKVKYIYTTNDVLTNPWDTLPPYLEELADKVFQPVFNEWA